MATLVAAADSGLRQHTLWIDGRQVASEDHRVFDTVNPFDGSTAARYANAGERDVAAAVLAARAAFDDGPWPRSSARERFGVLSRAAAILADQAEQFAQAMVQDSGKPVTVARGEVQGAIKTFEYYAGAALGMEEEAIAQRVHNALGLILREPIGVAAFITPWNFPLLNPVCKIAPALAAGCTMVIKPSHLCPGPVMLLAELLERAGLPAGVLNAITSDIDRGALVGQFLASSPLVDKVAFTGSTATGRAVMRAAAANNKKVSLELGGKSANIVFDDAPFEAAAATAITAFCFNSGQQCSAGSRLLVQRSIHERFVEAIGAQAKLQRVGDPQDPTVTMGPLVNQEQFDRVTSYIALGREEGRLVTGGQRPTAPECGRGFFVEPTIFDGVDNASRLAQEEVFGPVLAVIPFEDETEAVRLANGSRYGLAGGVWTRSLDRALRTVKAVRTGKMFVNAYNSAGIDDMPHGGCKDSGVGREFGRVGLEEFQYLKTVQIKFDA